MPGQLLNTARKIAEDKERSIGRQDAYLPPDFDLDSVIGYKPRALQQQIADQERRFNAQVIHRRFGKTLMKVRKLMHAAVHCPFEMGRYAYTAPTYQQAEDIAWSYLLTWAQRVYVHLNLKEQEWVDRSKLAVWLPTYNGSPARIRIYGTDSPKQTLRGLYLDGVVLDEWAQMNPSVWSEQVRPMLSDEERRGYDATGRRNQWADFIFTPKGRNHAHSTFRKAMTWYEGNPVREQGEKDDDEEEHFSDEWSACQWPASETGVLSRRELNAARRELGRSKYMQEYEVSFDAAMEGAIYANELEWLRREGRVQIIPATPLLPVHTGWDLGWDDATAIWFAQIQDGELRLIDYYEASGAPLHHYAHKLAQRGYTYGKHFFPHDVQVHELGTGQSRMSLLREAGVRVSVVPKVQPVDRIAAVQATLPSSRIDKVRCADGLDKLALYRREYDERRGVFREQPLHDWTSHAADALGTLVLGLQNRLNRRGNAGDAGTHAEM